MSADEKQSDTKEGEDLSRALLKLYRLAYESMLNDNNNYVKTAYDGIANEFTAIFQSLAPPKSYKSLIAIIANLLSNAKNEYIYGARNEITEEKEPKVALVEYCEADNIDFAILYLLNHKFRLQDLCKTIVNYVHKVSAGWSSYSYAAIHKVISNINRSAWTYQNKEEIATQFGIEKVDWNLDDETKEKMKKRNKPKEDIRDKYIANVINSKYGKTVFLIEMLLREHCSTAIKSNASGWRVSAKNETVFNAALSSNNIDILRLIFKFGVDIDIETTCTSGGSSMRTDSSSSWKPIHTAIEKNNYELTSLIIKRGANINSYRTHTMQNEYGSRQNRQQTALYMICYAANDGNKMLKLILKEHEQKNNGIPDVNKFNCYVSSENKPKEVYKAQRKAARKLEGGDADSEQLPDDNGWDDPRSGFYVNPYINLNNYETSLHVAVRKGDIEEIKLLLIYGGDISLCSIQSEQGYGGYGGTDRSVLMRKWYDTFMRNYRETKKLETYDSVKDVYQILKESKVDENVKNKIEKIFVSKSIWFPEMLHFYPNNMGQALSVITGSLSDIIPVEIVNIVIEYFYNIVEQTVKEADKTVDIKNAQISEKSTIYLME